MNYMLEAVRKIVLICEKEDLPYVITGGFAVGFYNWARSTGDIDLVVQIPANQVEKIVRHYPTWTPFLPIFQANALHDIPFELFDFDTGVKLDFMVFHDSEYNRAAFERRRFVEFSGIRCAIASPEDLIVAKLKAYEITKSEKQLADLTFLLELPGLDKQYLEKWAPNLTLPRPDYFKTINSTREFELQHANWYFRKPDEWKANFLSSFLEFGLAVIKNNARQKNPFATEADQMRLYVESNLKKEFPPVSFAFILEKLDDRSETEWKQRFKAMRKHLGWSYDDIARFIGAASGAAVRASVNRKLPAMAKLAVCVFEQMRGEEMSSEKK